MYAIRSYYVIHSDVKSAGAVIPPGIIDPQFSPCIFACHDPEPETTPNIDIIKKVNLCIRIAGSHRIDE